MRNTVHRKKGRSEGIWYCSCGNNTMSGGFETCSSTGTPMEPDAGTWTGYYKCDCGLVFNMDDVKTCAN